MAKSVGPMAESAVPSLASSPASRWVSCMQHSDTQREGAWLVLENGLAIKAMALAGGLLIPRMWEQSGEMGLKGPQPHRARVASSTQHHHVTSSQVINGSFWRLFSG
jgi:hypothetical protein